MLKTPQQIRDTKACVNDIANIVANQVNSGSLSLQQGNALKQLLTRLMVLINLDSYQLAADQAEAAGKLQVALHYHQQAKKLFSTQKGLDQQADLKQHAMAIDQHINRLNETISKQSSDLIKRELDEKEKLRQQQADATEPGNSRINDEAQWKKKQVYD